MRQILFSILGFWVLSVVANAQTNDLFDKLLYKSGSDTLPYRFLKPVNPAAMERFPLIIFLHGSGERGNDNENQLKHISNAALDVKNRSKYPCYVLAPQCAKQMQWAEYGENASNQPTKPAKMLMELIAQIEKDFPIDPDRIYITGLSMGGYGTWDLVARYPNKFAAAVPVCGGGDVKSVEKIKQIPIWAFHGALDNIVPPKRSRSMIAALQNVGANPGYTEYPDVEHNSWVQAYQEPHLFPWLFKQSRKAANPK